MHPIYFSHGYREREAPFAAYFSSLMAKLGFVPSLDPPSDDVNSAKLERHLSYTNGMVSVLSNRGTGPSPHILYEVSMAVRCNKPTLLFVEDSVPEKHIPNGVMVKRFSEHSYIRETTDHLYALERLSAYIGKQQLPVYRGFEKQRACFLVGGEKLERELRSEVCGYVENMGYQISKLPATNKTLPLSGQLHAIISNSNLAISVLTSKSASNSYALGVLQSNLVPTIMLASVDYPLIKGVPDEYQRRVITNTNIQQDLELIKHQINLYEEDFIQIDSTGKADKYADKLASSTFPGQYTQDFRTSIIQEVTMGDRYSAGQVGAQGPNAHAHDINFNQIWQQNEGKMNLSDLSNELESLRNSLQNEANTAEQFSEIGTIANAEIEAKNGDGPKALESLSKAGKWSLSVAEKIGVGVATAAIKGSLGI